MWTLNIGSGNRKVGKNGVNVDITNRTNPDIIWDLNITPWPFKDGEFNFVLGLDIIEHLDKPIKAIEEIYRVLNEGGCTTLRLPKWDMSQSYDDITHLHWFTENSLDYFIPETEKYQQYGFYSNAKFKLLNKKVDGSEIVFELQKIS